MDVFTWEFDAPTGTYKNHELSRRLWEQAVAETRFVDFTQPIDGFGKGMGESVTLTRVKAMAEPSDVTLIEGTRIPEDEFEITTRQISISEIGRAVPYTSLSQDLSMYDLMNPIQRKLLEQLRLSLDTMASKAFKKTPLKATPEASNALNIATNGSFGGSAAAATVSHVSKMRDSLFGTYFVPPWSNGDYVMLAHTNLLRKFKDDTNWETWHKYTDPSAKYNSEVGRFEQVRFVEVNHTSALSSLSKVGGQAVIFGQDAVALAEVMTPELRVAAPDDFGRSRAVAWYGILNFDIIWETANAGEVKIMQVGNS